MTCLTCEIRNPFDRMCSTLAAGVAALQRIADTIQGPPPSDADAVVAEVRAYAYALPDSVGTIRNDLLAIVGA